MDSQKTGLISSIRKYAGSQQGMSVTELMVGLCITAILAAVAIPSYISYIQQARVVAMIIPRLHLIETSISLFYSESSRLPGNGDVGYILQDIETKFCDVVLANGTIAMTINAPERSSKLHILDGKVLVASPVITREKIVSWHLSGELADRLRINY